jgi:hypothetical protein
MVEPLLPANVSNDTVVVEKEVRVPDKPIVPQPPEQEIPLPEDDVDSQHVTEDVSTEVEKEMETEPKPATRTTSFYTMIAFALAGIIVTFLIGKGWLPVDMHDQGVQVFAGMIGLAIAWVSGKYIEGRSQVSAIKAQIAGVEQLHLKGVSAPISLGRF